MCWNMKITQIFRLGVNALDVKVHALDVKITFLSNDPQSSSSSSSLSVPSWADEIAKDIITITRLLFKKVFGTLSREENYQQSLILGTISVEEFQSSLSKTWDPFNVYTLMNSADLKPFPEPPVGAFFPFFDS